MRKHVKCLALIAAVLILSLGLAACEKTGKSSENDAENTGNAEIEDIAKKDVESKSEKVGVMSESKAEAWIADLEQFKHDLEWYNADPYGRFGKEAFNADFESLRAEIPKLTEQEANFRLRKLVYSLGDGHIDIWGSSDMTQMLPVMIDRLADKKYYIVNASSGLENYIGKEVKTINGHNIEDIISKFSEISNSESEYWQLAGAINKLHFAYYYELAGFVDEYTNVINIDGEDFECYASFFSSIKDAAWARPLRIYNIPNFYIWSSYTTQKPYSHSWTEDGKVLHIEFSSCNEELEDYPLVDFGKDLRAEILEKNPEAVLLDLRANGGGSPAALFSVFSTDFIKSSGLMDNPNFYIATDNQTFSAGSTTTKFVTETWGATQIGTPTGGSAHTTNVSETAEKELKYNDLGFRISSDSVNKKTIENPSEIPDIVIERTIEDILEGRDPVLEYVKSRL